MPYVKGKRYPYTDAGKKAAYKAANSVKQPITDVMSEIGGGRTSKSSLKTKSKLKPSAISLKKKSKLKPYKLKQGRV